MKSLVPIAGIVAITLSGAAFAGDDCHSPMAEWQSREAVTAYASGLGVTTDRLRIDDGCYEIRGRDTDGNRIELKIEPATLEVMELEVRFQAGADRSRYLKGGQAGTATPSAAGSGGAPAQGASTTRAVIN